MTLISLKLQNLAEAFRKVGSAGIVSSSLPLRKRLSTVLFLFSDNASKVYPEVRLDYPHNVPWSQTRNLTLENLPKELEQLAEDLMTFLRYLQKFPDLTHAVRVNKALISKEWYIAQTSHLQPLNASILAFNGDLMVKGFVQPWQSE